MADQCSEGRQAPQLLQLTPGRAGQREANAKADKWLESNINAAGQRFGKVWALYLENVKATGGTSNYEQIEKFGENYILPVCEYIKMDSLTEGNLQDVLDKAYKNGCLKAGYKRPAGAGL